MQSPKHNGLLEQLPPHDYERLLPHLERIHLDKGQVLFRADEPCIYRYFPTTCVVSAQVELTDGGSAEIFLAGDRGLVGIHNVHHKSFYAAVMRKEGYAYRCCAEVFQSEIRRGEGVFEMMAKITCQLMREMAQRLVDKTFSSIDQQVAHCLLNWQLLVRSDRAAVTHSTIASALGVRREAVTIALNNMARLGVLSLGRGSIQILSRKALLDQAWVDYGSVAMT